nr:PEP_CTERM-anchored TLD domain-containing protein [Nitrosomonas nitrosa]
MKRFLKCLTGIILMSSPLLHADTIVGGGVLDSAGANKLEMWLGVSDQDFINVFDRAIDITIGITNVYDDLIRKTPADWHAVVDDIGPTFTIYEVVINTESAVTLEDTTTLLIGGYTDASWAGNNSFQHAPNSFIFNLTTDEVQYTNGVNGSVAHPRTEIFKSPDALAVFGGGWDIYVQSLGSGSVASYSYDTTQGNIISLNDSGEGNQLNMFTTRVSTYIIRDTNTLPNPHILMLFCIAILSLLLFQNKK